MRACVRAYRCTSLNVWVHECVSVCESASESACVSACGFLCLLVCFFVRVFVCVFVCVFVWVGKGEKYEGWEAFVSVISPRQPGCLWLIGHYHSLQVVSDSVSMHKDGFQYFFKTTSKTPSRLGLSCPMDLPFFLGGGRKCPRELVA